MFLRTVIDLDLMVNFLNLFFMFFLSSSKLFNVHNIYLLSMLIHCFFPSTKCLISNETIDTLNRSYKEFLGILPPFVMCLPCIDAILKCLAVSDITKPINLSSYIVKSLHLLNLLLISHESVSEFSSLNSLG